MRSDHFFLYAYQTKVGTAVLRGGGVEVDLLASLDLRRRKTKPSIKSLRRKGVLISNEVRWGHVLAPLLVSKSKRPPRRNMVFAREQMWEVVERDTADLRKAVQSIYQQLDSEMEDVSTEYGMHTNLRAEQLGFDPSEFCCQGPKPTDSPPDVCWSRFLTGVRFPQDQHPHTLWSHFGVLDMIKHDPTTGVAVATRDIRSLSEVEPINCGKVALYRRRHDLHGFRVDLELLLSFLRKTNDQGVKVVCLPSHSTQAQIETAFEQTGLRW